MLNKAMLIGRLGSDPQIAYTQSGLPITHLSIATSSIYTNKDGERVQNTEWHRVVVFGRPAENAVRYLRKGRLVYVEGELRTRKWQDKQGSDRYTTEINAKTIYYLEKLGNGEGREAHGQENSDQYGYSDNYGGSGYGDKSYSPNPPGQMSGNAQYESDMRGGSESAQNSSLDNVPF